MAYFYVALYPDAKEIALDYPLAQERIALAGSDNLSAVFDANNGKPMVARISTDAACQFERGSAPSTTSASEYLSAGGVEYVRLKAGGKFAVRTPYP